MKQVTFILYLLILGMTSVAYPMKKVTKKFESLVIKKEKKKKKKSENNLNIRDKKGNLDCTKIPVDIWLEIFDHMGKDNIYDSNLGALATTSKYFNNVVRDYINKIIKPLFLNDFPTVNINALQKFEVEKNNINSLYPVIKIVTEWNDCPFLLEYLEKNQFPSNVLWYLNDHDESALSVALEKKKPLFAKAIVQYLIDEKAIDSYDSKGYTALCLTVKYANKELFDYLIKYKNAMNCPSEGGASLVLHATLYPPSYYFIKKILKKNRNLIFILSTNKYTVLHCAVSMRHWEIARFILEYIPKAYKSEPSGSSRKAFLKNIIHSKNNDGNTPLHLACMNKDGSIVQLLLEYGANRTIKNTAGELAESFLGDNQQLAAIMRNVRQIHFLK